MEGNESSDISCGGNLSIGAVLTYQIMVLKTLKILYLFKEDDIMSKETKRDQIS